jgi:hypothetical protein
MSKYQTISVPKEVKAALEKAKGDKEWGEYLLNLKKEAEDARHIGASQKLRELLTDEDLDKMRRASREFRENFELR